jgi:hypothetical protein
VLLNADFADDYISRGALLKVAPLNKSKNVSVVAPCSSKLMKNHVSLSISNEKIP